MNTVSLAKIGPWPDVATARLFLASLAGLTPESAINLTGMDPAQVAQWLIDQGLGPLAYAHCRDSQPELAQYLAMDSFTAVAQSSLSFAAITQIEAAFAEAEIPVVLLKGAALALTAYEDVALRTMSDIDIWVQDAAMPQAAVLMKELGFRAHGGRTDRSLALQMLSQGEIQFYGENWGMVELHWSPFPGWWLTRTAAVAETAVWERIEPITAGENIYQLGAEDMIIQVAVHLAVNSQFGIASVRGLLDMALTAKTRPVEWPVVAERAKAWRVGTAVWQALFLLDQLIGLPEAAPALALLRPSNWRRRWLRRLISPEAVLKGADLRHGRSRYLLLLLLIDRIQDMIYLSWRTLWPETAWMAARYPQGASRWHHLWQVVRYGRI